MAMTLISVASKFQIRRCCSTGNFSRFSFPREVPKPVLPPLFPVRKPSSSRSAAKESDVPDSRKQICDLCRAHVVLPSIERLDKMTLTETEMCEPQMLSHEQLPQLLNEIDTFIFDADGVLWLGEEPIEGSPEFLDFLIRMNKRIIVLTNNATKSRAVYAKKLNAMGYHERINKNIIVNPAAVVADTLHRSGIKQADKKVYLIGCQGVREELQNLGIEVFGDGPDPIERQADSDRPFLYELELDHGTDEVGAVVVGYEKHFNYHKLMKAANYLQQEECLFVATNEDETLPTANKELVVPDAGPLVAAVKVAAGREPLVVGKPNSPAFDYICRRWNIDPTRTLMIGDRTNTDVKFGRDHGLRTMLVLSGCHQVEDIVDHQVNERDDMVPDFYAERLGALLPQRQQA